MKEKNMMKIYVIGASKIRDTDSICSAIGYAHLKTGNGAVCSADESRKKLMRKQKFVLDYF